MERRIFADPDQIVVCVSGMVRDEIARRFGVAEDRLVVIHNAVDTARFDPNRQRTAARSLRAELGPEKGTVWLFAGSGWRQASMKFSSGQQGMQKFPWEQLITCISQLGHTSTSPGCLSFGSGAEVLEPEGLRAEVARELEDARVRYQSTS